MNIKPANLALLNSGDYRVYLSDMLKSSGQSDAQIAAQPYMNDNVNSGTYYAYHNNTDWQKQVFNNSFNQNYYLKVSGGDAIAKYTLSLGYGNDGSVTKNSGVNKYNTRFNADLNLSKNLPSRPTCHLPITNRTCLTRAFPQKPTRPFCRL